MANHKSAEKRARQSLKIRARNNQVRSRVHSVERTVKESLTDPKKASEALKKAFHVIQKARGVLHRNAVRRKMARLSKAVARAGVAS